MRRFFSKFLFLIFAISALFCQPAAATPTNWVWHDNGVYSTDQHALCVARKVGIISLGLYYNGGKYDKANSDLQPGSNGKVWICRDTDFPNTIDHSWEIGGTCRYVDATTGVVSYDANCTLEITTGCLTVGNPTDIFSLSKSETATDWQSPRDPRFKFDRHYSSNYDVYSNLIYPNGAPGMMSLGGVWRGEFDQRLIKEGNIYTQGPYSNAPGGENSNTAAFNTIRNSGGTPPNIWPWNNSSVPPKDHPKPWSQ